VAAALGLAPAEDADRFLVSAGVLSLLSAAADRGPLLCVIDDAQWLDVPSADPLVFTARRLAVEAIVILFAAREGELRRFDGPGLPQLTLGGLGREPAMRLLARSAPDAVAHVRHGQEGARCVKNPVIEAPRRSSSCAGWSSRGPGRRAP
jgi:hypothetical protein